MGIHSSRNDAPVSSTYDVSDTALDGEKIKDICKRFSKDNPITEEEADDFLKKNCLFPQPKHPHVTLSAEDIKGKRIFVIGDVHGCYDHLMQLLKKAGVHDDPNSLVIFVGDIINKGPKNCEVLKFVRSSGALSVMGNHERTVVRKLRLIRMNVGYEPKLEKRWMYDLSEDDCHYLEELPLTISIPSLDAVIVHAGLVAGKRLEDHTQDELVYTRNIIVDGEKLTATKSAGVGVLWGSLWNGPQHVYFGHHAAQGLQKHPYAMGLDTGCVYRGRLTGVFLTGDKQLISFKDKS